MAVKPIPDGYHSLTPIMVLHDCARAIDYYKRVFGARERVRFDGPDGKVAHCELELGDSLLMLGEAGEMSPKAMRVMLYVESCDDVFNRAVRDGATVSSPLEDKFYGDRSGTVTDPFGNEWNIATHVEDVSEEEMLRRMQAMSATQTAAE